jgi:hypothetical protein
MIVVVRHKPRIRGLCFGAGAVISCERQVRIHVRSVQCKTQYCILIPG